MEFHQYMQLANETWANITSSASNTSDTGNTRGKLIMTTEDPTIFEQRHSFPGSHEFPLDFVINDEDPLQGTGNTKSFQDAADTIMISSLVALQMNLHADIIYGNCCSNFHLVLFDLAREGCGVTSKTPICLQETEKYNICCHWTRSEVCNAIRSDHKNRMEKDRESKRQEAEKLLMIMQAQSALSSSNGTNSTPVPPGIVTFPNSSSTSRRRIRT